MFCQETEELKSKVMVGRKVFKCEKVHGGLQAKEEGPFCPVLPFVPHLCPTYFVLDLLTLLGSSWERFDPS